MIVQIRQFGEDIFITSMDDRFKRTWGEVYRTSSTLLNTNLQEIAGWAMEEYEEPLLADIRRKE